MAKQQVTIELSCGVIDISDITQVPDHIARVLPLPSPELFLPYKHHLLDIGRIIRQVSTRTTTVPDSSQAIFDFPRNRIEVTIPTVEYESGVFSELSPEIQDQIFERCAVEPLSPMDTYFLEKSMRPSRLSTRGFLGPYERLSRVLEEDDNAVGRLGITHNALADRIESVILGTFTPDYLTLERKDFRGGQECPWKCGRTETKSDPYAPPVPSMPHSGCDYVVTDARTGESLSFPGGIVHLIREHKFYEGTKSPYRVEPEKAARVLELISPKA